MFGFGVMANIWFLKVYSTFNGIVNLGGTPTELTVRTAFLV
jgi:hypothetical protein